jgi:hypothetical protein
MRQAARFSGVATGGGPRVTVTRERTTVFVYLLDEGTDVWRPVVAESLSTGLYRLIGPVSADEHWEFQPGDVVRCTERTFADGTRGLVAVERDTAAPPAPI